MPDETLAELMEKHLEDSLRTWSRRPLAELVHEFVNVRGDLGNPEATAHFVRLLSLKLEEAEKAAAIKVLRDLIDESERSPRYRIARAALRKRAEKIEEGLQ